MWKLLERAELLAPDLMFHPERLRNMTMEQLMAVLHERAATPAAAETVMDLDDNKTLQSIRQATADSVHNIAETAVDELYKTAKRDRRIVRD
jgi:hypothetical protein